VIVSSLILICSFARSEAAVRLLCGSKRVTDLFFSCCAVEGICFVYAWVADWIWHVPVHPWFILLLADVLMLGIGAHCLVKSLLTAAALWFNSRDYLHVVPSDFPESFFLCCSWWIRKNYHFAVHIVILFSCVLATVESSCFGLVLSVLVAPLASFFFTAAARLFWFSLRLLVSLCRSESALQFKESALRS
jgi:hypothetical protein